MPATVLTVVAIFGTGESCILGEDGEKEGCRRSRRAEREREKEKGGWKENKELCYVPRMPTP